MGNSNVIPFQKTALRAAKESAFEKKVGVLWLKAFALEFHSDVFSDGDIATWKPGLRNRTYPAYGDPILVRKVLVEPIIDQRDLEPQDILAGYVDRDGDYREGLFDSRRLTKVNKDGKNNI